MNSQSSSRSILSSQPALASSSANQPQSLGSNQGVLVSLPPVPPLHSTDHPTQVFAMTGSAEPGSDTSTVAPVAPVAPPSWQTATPGYVPPPTYSPSYQYVEFSRTLTDQITTQWVPHAMSFQERFFYVNQTRQLVCHINHLEEQRVNKNPKVEHDYTLARIQYSVLFGRVFRINDLPTEILSTILRLACWSADTPSQHSLWRLWLTSTCSRFRTVMLEDPTLWTAIVFHDVSQLHQAVTYMQRAGGLPFDVRIGESRKGPMKHEHIISLFNEMWRKISQLRTLIVVVKDWDPIVHIVHQLARVHAEQIPLIIEHLEIHRTGPYYVQSGVAFPTDVYENPPPLFGGALVPTLRIISLDAIHTNWQYTRLCNLTTLDIRKLPFTRSPNNVQFRDLLRSNPGLKKLLMDGAGPSWPLDIDEANAPPVVLHELEQLVLGDFSLLYGIHLLSLFRTPNMTDLTLLNTCGDDQPAFFDALRPLCANVRILSLFKCESTFSMGMTHAIVTWLHSMKHLAYLRVCDVNDHLLRLFMFDPVTLNPYTSPDTVHGVICPKLSILEMQRTPAERISQFASFRGALGAPLEKVLVPVWMRHTISTPQTKALLAALRPRGQLLVLMGKAPEEEALRKALTGQPQAPNVRGQGQV